MKRTYYLKSIILLLAVFAFLSACTAKSYTPVLQTEFKVNAVYKTGHFSYRCRIHRSNGAVFVTVLSTKAAGLVIGCDGKTVTFVRNDMKTAFPREQIDSTNPAVVLYETFASLENDEALTAVRKNGCFVFEGKTSIGDAQLIQTERNTLKSMTVPAADITVEFDA